jgi:hypothetical protein
MGWPCGLKLYPGCESKGTGLLRSFSESVKAAIVGFGATMEPQFKGQVSRPFPHLS